MHFNSVSTFDLTSLPATISLQPAGSSLPVAIPAIANRALMNADALHVGDTLRMSLGGRDREIVLSGVMDAFPTTDATIPALLLDLQTLEAIQLAEPGNRMDDPSQEWLSVAPGATGRLTEQLVAQPFQSSRLVSEAERARSLQADPVILGTIVSFPAGSWPRRSSP